MYESCVSDSKAGVPAIRSELILFQGRDDMLNIGKLAC